MSDTPKRSKSKHDKKVEEPVVEEKSHDKKKKKEKPAEEHPDDAAVRKSSSKRLKKEEKHEEPKAEEKPAEETKSEKKKKEKPQSEEKPAEEEGKKKKKKHAEEEKAPEEKPAEEPKADEEPKKKKKKHVEEEPEEQPKSEEKHEEPKVDEEPKKKKKKHQDEPATAETKTPAAEPDAPAAEEAPAPEEGKKKKKSKKAAAATEEDGDDIDPAVAERLRAIQEAAAAEEALQPKKTEEEEIQELLDDGWIAAPTAAPSKPPPSKPLPRTPGENILPGGLWSMKPDTRGLGLDEPPEPEPVIEEPKEPVLSFEGTELAKKYTVGEEIAKTGFARIHKITDSTGKELVVRVITTELSALNTPAAIQRQSKMLKKIVGIPNTCQPLDTFLAESAAYFVFEKREGDIGSVIKKHGADWNEKLASSTIKQLLEALKALHEKKIAHRNVTVLNILVKSFAKDGIQVELGGFSQAISAKKPLTTDSICLDTYKSPEMAASQPYDVQSDLWMLACCACIILSGVHPFGQEKNRMKRRMSITRVVYKLEPAEWDHVSDDAKDFIKKILLLKPAERLTAEAALQHPWITSGGKDTPLPAVAEKIVL